MSRIIAPLTMAFVASRGASPSHSPIAGGGTFTPVVLAVNTDSITIRTGRIAGLKVTDVDDAGYGTPEQPSNLASYKVLPATEITVDDLPGKLSDIHPGMIVAVVIGINHAVADSISAHTLPPPARIKVKAMTVKGRPGIARLLRGAETVEIVLALTDTRITVGVPGTARARAYYIKPSTTVTWHGEPDSVHVGDKVYVHNDGTRAWSIEVFGQ